MLIIIDKTCISSNRFFIFFLALGYWIGGYNFHNDDDMEWVGEPNQVMPFSDMAANQPSNPKTELCMMMWKSWDFQWADHFCGSLLSYVCEFMHH